jgi:hypothetical protein
MDMQREILTDLEAVDAERSRRDGTVGLRERVAGLKDYQQKRFARTYGDLLVSDRYGRAARFFLDDLYGPRDFTGRDRQFARIVPSLVRLFPADVVALVARLAKLHSLSEHLDTEMALQPGPEAAAWSGASYVSAWLAVGRESDRRRQVAWTLEIGRGLDRLVGKPLLVRSLKLMRGPAQLAGLGELQAFLERGLDAFRAMHGAAEFLRIIDQREEVLMRLLFGQPARDVEGLADLVGTAWEAEVLGQLP